MNLELILGFKRSTLFNNKSQGIFKDFLSNQMGL